MPWSPDALTTLAQWGCTLTPEARDRLDRYVALIRQRGRSLNLVSAGDCGRLYDRHLFDSLVAVPLIEWEGKHVVDIGSGAGLPGIPLAIACPAARFSLVDRTRKRAAFLVGAIRSLALPNAEAKWGAMRDLARTGALAHADVVTARAVASTEDVLGLAAEVMVHGSSALLWQTEEQWHTEPTPEGFRAQWVAIPSRDGVRRGIRMCSRRED